MKEPKYKPNQKVVYRGCKNYIDALCLQVLSDENGKEYTEWTYKLKLGWPKGFAKESSLDKEN